MKQSVLSQKEHDPKTGVNVVAREVTIETSLETDPLSDFLSMNLEARLPAQSRRAKSKVAAVCTHTSGFRVNEPLTQDSLEFKSQSFLN